MKPDDIRAMSEDQLRDKIVQLKKEQFNLRFQAATAQIENTGQFRAVRRDIARLKTELNAKSRSAQA